MDEDTEEKIRRNLVIASTFIILVTFLSLDISPILSDFLKLKGTDKIPAIKIWVCLGTVLAYLWTRYRWTQLGVAGFNEVSTTINERQRARHSKQLDSKRRNLKADEVQFSFIDDSIRAHVADRFQEHLKDIAASEKTRFEEHIRAGTIDLDRHTAYCSLTITNSQDSSINFQWSYTRHISRTWRWVQWSLAGLSTITYSAEATSALLPRFMAACAGLCIAVQIYSSLQH